MSDPTILLQVDAAPLFSVEPDCGETLVCCGCGDQVLINGYRPELFVDVTLTCFACGHQTSTPDYRDGKLIPHFHALFPAGTYEIAQASIHPSKEDPGIPVVVSKRALDRERGALGPRITELSAPRFETEEDIAALVAQYDALSGNSFAKQAASVARAEAHADRRAALQDAFPWMIAQIRRMNAASVLDFSVRENVLALTNLTAWHHATTRWDQHPAYAAIMGELRNGSKFHHIMAQLVAAAAFWSLGIRAGLTPSADNGDRAADLFLQRTSDEKLHVEVKSPLALASTNVETMHLVDLSRCVLSALVAAKGQITRKKRGILVLAGGIMSDNAHDRLMAAVDTTLRRKGHDHSGVAGVIVLNIQPDIQPLAGGGISFDASYRHQASINPRFNGRNPLATAPAQPPTGLAPVS